MTHTIIFGGSKGLGRVIARQLALRGDSVSVISRSRLLPAQCMNGVSYYLADITDKSSTQDALDTAIKKNGGINYLIFSQRYRGKNDAWDGEIEVSLTSSKRVVESVQDSFVKGSDCGIVFVSSVFGEYIGEGQDIGYHIVKSGINHMARFYAVSLGKKGIRSNAVTPFTFLKEESQQFYFSNKELMGLYEEMVPIGRIGTAEDTANLIMFLCSVDASYVSGQNIYVDGGLSLVWPESLARKLKTI
jgi:NAD(P)-dependent dehydrogenase (short-subunit alcohol dehydrogenase family)